MNLSQFLDQHAYADTEASYHALTTHSGLWTRRGWNLHQLTGADRLRFLHNYCTQDVAELPPGRTAYATVLTVKGAMLGEFYLIHQPETSWLITPAGARDTLFPHLEKYARFDDVSFEFSLSHTLLTLLGPHAARTLEAADLPLPPGGHNVLDANWGEPPASLTIARSPLLTPETIDLIVPNDRVADVALALLQHDATLLHPDAVEQLRIETGLPVFGLDTHTSTIPVEAGLEDRAISYAKGCYLGQETIVRIKHRGRVNKALAAVRLDAPPADLPQPLFSGDKQVGTLGATAPLPKLQGAHAGLCVLHRKYLEPPAQLTLGAPDGPPAHVLTLPLHT